MLLIFLELINSHLRGCKYVINKDMIILVWCLSGVWVTLKGSFEIASLMNKCLTELLLNRNVILVGIVIPKVTT